MTICPECSKDVLNERGSCANCGYVADLRMTGPDNPKEER